MRSAITAAVVVAVVTLAGCSSYDSVTQRIAQSITPYRITVVQGNFVSQEKASQLQAGMTREQVRALLGTPLLADMFHADRWDYLFYFKRGSTSVVQQRDLVVHFQNDRLASWSGAENLPSELDLLADIDGDRRGKKKANAAGFGQPGRPIRREYRGRARGQPRHRPGIGPGLAGQPLPAVLADRAVRADAGRPAAGSEPGDPAAVPVPSSAAAYRAERRQPAGRPAGLRPVAEPAADGAAGRYLGAAELELSGQTTQTGGFGRPVRFRPRRRWIRRSREAFTFSSSSSRYATRP